MSSDQPTTFRNVVHTFTTFLTVAIHTILYDRQIYPQTSFLSARKYNLAVRQNRHPKVCEWINDAVACVQEQMLKGVVDRVAIVIYSNDNKALERYVFDLSPLPTVPETDVDIHLSHEGAGGDAVLPIIDLEEQFRALLNKLSTSSSALDSLPTGCTFTVAIELKDRRAPLQHPQAWVPAPPKADRSQTSESTTSGAKTVPVRAVDGGILAFDAWIEESAQKVAAVESVTSSTTS